MIRWYGKVFDDVVSVETPVYTSIRHAEHLGGGDQVGVHVVLDRQTNVASVGVVQEHSADGINWGAKAAGVNFTTTVGAGTSTIQGFSGETYPTRPSLDLVRLRITMTRTSPVAPGSLHVVAHAVVRDRSDEPLPCECPPAGSAPLDQTAEEVARLERRRPQAALAELVRHVQALAPPRDATPAEAMQLVLGRLSPHALVELERYARHLARATPEAGQAAASTLVRDAIQAARAEAVLRSVVQPPPSSEPMTEEG